MYVQPEVHSHPSRQERQDGSEELSLQPVHSFRSSMGLCFYASALIFWCVLLGAAFLLLLPADAPTITSPGNPLLSRMSV